MKLRDVFIAVCAKQLVAVDLPSMGSHQHEVNGTKALQDFFATTEQISGSVEWYYFADDEDPLYDSGTYSFYDARARSAERTGRSEWRLYYSGAFLQNASVGDILILCRLAEGSIDNGIQALVFQAGSSWLSGARTIFGAGYFGEIGDAFRTLPEAELRDKDVEFAAERILEELGIAIPSVAQPSDETLVVQRFGHKFPSTLQMAQLAREQVGDVDYADPDSVLTQWLVREEQLFRALERVIVQQQLDQGFQGVDEFIQYSLSVQNRRKSRMGYALQNHLSYLFEQLHIEFQAQARTEGRNTPDFLFPGGKQYRDPSYPAEYLTMLAVKSSLKERWRQVLTEAERINTKHLCTMEPGISEHQISEMARHQLVLVLPENIRQTGYSDKQRQELLNIQDFTGLVKQRQAASGSVH